MGGRRSDYDGLFVSAIRCNIEGFQSYVHIASIDLLLPYIDFMTFTKTNILWCTSASPLNQERKSIRLFENVAIITCLLLLKRSESCVLVVFVVCQYSGDNSRWRADGKDENVVNSVRTEPNWYHNIPSVANCARTRPFLIPQQLH